MDDMLTTLRVTGVVLDVIGLAVLLAIMFILLVLNKNRQSVIWNITLPAVGDQPEKTVTVQQVEQPPEPPGTSCAHCGTRIKSDPIKQTVLEKETYTVHACPKCGKLSALLTLAR